MRNPILPILIAIVGCGTGSVERSQQVSDDELHRRDGGSTTASVKTVFVIVLENHNWRDFKGSASAPYLNETLLGMGAHAEAYSNPPGVHPSEPNYLWMEAGTGFGIRNDRSPSRNHQSTTQHLVSLLDGAGISWRAYLEGVDGRSCPLEDVGRYAVKHNPFAFFDDITAVSAHANAAAIDLNCW